MSIPHSAAQLGPRFNEAFLYAAEKHASQKRKRTDVPYISHLMSVAALVLEAGGGEDEAIAALLHDVVEDCGGHPVLEEIRGRFGDRVAHIVDGCTDAYTIPKPPWKARSWNTSITCASARRRSSGQRSRQAPQCPLRLWPTSEKTATSLGSLQRPPRRHALVLPRCSRCAA